MREKGSATGRQTSPGPVEADTQARHRADHAKRGPPAGALRPVLKFRAYDQQPEDPALFVKKPPSHTIRQLTKLDTHVNGWRPRPKILELRNMADFTHQTVCAVPMGEPLFQPFPPEVTFFGYQPFMEYTSQLCFRNNDVVPRSLKVEPLENAVFSVTRVTAVTSQSGAKVASGMEVVYMVKFRPQTHDDQAADLVVATERERFVVPLIARGAAPALDLPDVLDFGADVTTGIQRTQLVLVRNVGTRTALFQLTTSQHFSVAPSEGSLGPGEVMQLRVSFTPPTSGVYQGEMEVRYMDSGVTTYARLRGEARDVDVSVSARTVTLLPTYVTKTSQKTFRVLNRSQEPVHFSIKAHPTPSADLEMARAKLEGLEAEGQGRREGSDRQADDAESEDEEAILASHSQKLAQHLKDQRRQTLLDQQLFGDKNFQCQPSSGLILPGCECEVTVRFSPDYTREYNVTAYVDVQGRSERLPIAFTAQGLGPAAVFSYDMLDVGDTYVNTLHQYEVELQNRGEIPVHYSLLAPSSAFGTKFRFEPNQGQLKGGQIQAIKVWLMSDLLGPFDEGFKWAIRGCSTPLTLQLKGRVRGPTCTADIDNLDFGIVSYGFRYSKEFTLSNTSEIPMRFTWRVPEDIASDPPEFTLVPPRGTILPHGKQRVCMELVSHTVQRYAAYRLVLDVPDVALEQLVIPISAECAVPRITVDENPLLFGNCSVRHPYKRKLTLINKSKLPSKFEVPPQNPGSRGLALWSAEPSSGGVPACGEQQIEITMCTQTLGRVQLPLRVHVPGSKGRPLEVTLDAKSVGPDLVFGAAADPVDALQPHHAIAFGTAPVLQDHVYELQVHNPGVIPASCKLFIESTSSSFSVTPGELLVDPGASALAHVTVRMDDTRVFADMLHVLVSEGADVCIPLTATGSGVTLVSEELAAPVLDLGHQFVGRPFEKHVVVTNHGRKTQEIQWTNMRLEDVKQQLGKAAKAAGRKFSLDMVPADEQPVFGIAPERIVLEPHQAATFTFSGLSLKSGDIQERFVCAGLDANSKPICTLFDIPARALVVTPVLEMSHNSMLFQYRYEPGMLPTLQMQQLTLRNISKLPVACQLKVQSPFTVDQPSLKLARFEAATLNVSFDPAFKMDQKSGVVRQRMQISYADTPQRDSIELVGRMDFPNLALDRTEVTFGSCLSDTTSRLPLMLTNTSAVDVTYTWAWDQDSLKEDANSMASVSMKQARQPRPPAIQLFDVLPIKGVLRPGETATASCSFFAYPGVKASVTAMCVVEGGPTYQVPMSGESNNIKFSLEPQFLDLGHQLFTKTVERDLVINNQGKVPFDFMVSTRLLSRPSIVAAVPSSGTVGSGHKQTVKLRVCAGIPQRLLETLLVELAHFDPIAIQLAVEGVYPALMVSLPRVTDDVYDACLLEAKAASAAPAPAGLPVAEVSDGVPVGTSLLISPEMPRRSPMTRAELKPGLGNPSLVRSGSMQSIAARSVGGVSVARSQGARSLAAASTVSKSGKLQLGAVELPLDKQLELAAERARLVKLIGGAELASVQAAEQALLQAELQKTMEEQPGGVMAVMSEQDPRAATKPAPSGRLPSTQVAPLSRSEPKRAPAQAATAGATGTAGTPRRGGPVQPTLPDLAAAHYLLDFGCIIKGASRTRRFKLTNTGVGAVTFKWDRALLESWGLRVEPESVSKLPGAPEMGSTEMAVTLSSGKRGLPLGPLELTLPVPIKGAPPVLITIKADIQVPDLELSQEVLQFGRVETGKCKAVTLQLRNSKMVPCEWEVKRPMEQTKTKDWAFFRCEPAAGIIEPGQWQNVRVIFTPQPGRDTPYEQVIPIKIAYNARGKDLQCTAAGDTPRIVFEPSSVNCGATLPATPEQAPVEARFRVVNPCGFPVEVVSLDFDPRWQSDEEVLRALDDSLFNDAGALYKEPLAPGAPLWPDLVAAHAQKLALAQAAIAQAAAGEGGPVSADHGVGELDSSPPALDATAGAASTVASAGKPPSSAKTFILLHGARMSGISAQAALMAKRYSLPACTFDDLLFEGADLELPPNDAAAQGFVPATPVQGDTPVPPAWDSTISDQLYGQVFIDPELAAKPDFLPPHTKLGAQELQELLLRGIQQALRFSPKLAGGLVLDTLSSQYCDPATAARVLLHAAGMSPILPPEPEVDPKAAKSKPKGKQSDTPPPPALPEAWAGPHRVFVVTLAPNKEAVAARIMQRQEQELKRAAAETAGASASELVPELTTQAEAPQDDPLEPADLVPVPPAIDPDAVDSEAQAFVDAANAQLSGLRDVLGQPAGHVLPDGRVISANAVQLVSVPSEAGMSPEDLHLACCGMRFRLGGRENVLPAIPSDARLIPPPYIMQVVTRPRARPPRQPVSKFQLFMVLPEDPESESNPAPAAKGTAGKTGAKTPSPVPGKGKSGTTPEPATNPQYKAFTRLVLPPNSAQELVVQFKSSDLGKFSELLGFEALGAERVVNLPVSGMCDYPRVSTDYRSIFARKVKARPSTPSVSRQYIISSGMFQFGPLLLGKDPTGYAEGKHPDNTARLRITNNGLFPAEVSLGFRSRLTIEDSKAAGKKAAAPPPGKGGPDKGAKPSGLQLDGVFVLSHQTLSLAVDETQEVQLYAFPQQEGEFTDELLIKVTDNPDPVVFPLSVIGAKPVVNVSLDEPSPEPSAMSDAHPKAPTKGSKAVADAPPANKLLSEGVVFERLLLGKHETKGIIISNPGLIPVEWRLLGVDQLPAELKVFPDSGRLEARSDVRVTVDFTAITKREVTAKLTLEVTDAANLLGVASSTPLAIKAEGYKMEVDVKFPQEGQACVDFGTVRVADSKSLPLVLRNAGKYAVKYAFTKRTPVAQELFTLVPESGSIEPGKDLTVQVVFNQAASLKREFTLASAPVIQLGIIEPLTSNKAEMLPIRVSVRAVFSRYSITPARGIIFGPITYNTTSKPRTFEIANSGDFAFDWSIINLSAPAAAPVPDPKDKKGASTKPTAKGAVPKGLAVGQFTVEPSEGTVEPGNKVEISVIFAAEGAQVCRETLGIHVGHRPLDDCPQGIPYEVVGESCIPGIDTSSWESIFEEHNISASLDPAGMVPFQLGLRERAFNFGPVVADLSVSLSQAPAAGGKDKKGVSPSPPTPPPATDAPGAPQRGVQAALKFSNPIKVPCTVNLSLKPRTPAVDPKSTAPFAMDVFPAQLVISPQETRYTTVTFAPSAIALYSATLEAVVEGGTDPRTKSFTCEIRGQGTLPSLSLLEPTVATPDGKPLLAFGRVLLGRSTQQNITLRNNGQLPASSRLDMAASPAFRVVAGPTGTFTVEPGRGVSFAIEFRPGAEGAVAHDLGLRVQRNPFEEYCVVLTGEGYREDIMLDGLPDNSVDTIRLQDAALGETRQCVFTLRNTSNGKHFRFKWPATVPSLSFSPAVGHILAGASKDVTLTFTSAVPVKLGPASLSLALIQIAHAPDTEPSAWDDRSQLIEYDDVGKPRRVPEQEPKVTDVAGSARELKLSVWATADNARYTCGAPPEGIVFKPTMMYQARMFTFPLTSTSTAQLSYKFSVQNRDGTPVAPEAAGLYTISPEGGTIPAGATATIAVRFAPQEVVDCQLLLVADMPGLDPAAAPLRIPLDGRIVRPWCHFDLADSDYISAGRRDTGLPGPSGNIEPLDPATKVLEFESLGVRVRNTKRFLVLNPTGIGYEFQWAPQGASSASSASPFRSVTPRGTIGPGRQFEMVFEYLPQADAKTEAFWVFSIPDQGITLPFLLVGHVSEPQVMFDAPCVNFGQCLVGGARGNGTVCLVNNEDLPFSFALDPASYEATAQQVALLGRRPAVEITPSQGVVPPHGKITLHASFAPHEERLYNFNVVCKVANKPTRLSLNVKGEGYAIHQQLQLDDGQGGVQLLSAQGANHIDFGQVVVNERSVKALALLNTGNLAYDFVWDCGVNPRVSAKPETGTVGKGQRCQVELAYNPHGPDKLREYKITCQIVNGPTYTVLLHGAGHRPRLDLSFRAHDFGLCAVWQPGIRTVSKAFRVTNSDTQPIAIDPQWSNQGGAEAGGLQPGDVWEHDLPACVLQPGQSVDGQIIFRPPDARHYSRRLLLEVNGLYTVSIDLAGEGTPLKVEPVSSAARVVSFGAVPVGSSASRTATLVNLGRVAAHVSLSSSAQSLLGRLGIQAMPATTVVLRPRERVDITLLYRPPERQRLWSEDLELDVEGVPMPLLRLQGSCSGTQLTLASDVLPFGPVAHGSSTVKRLALDNTGDTGTKFTWDAAALGPHFSISPAEGFLAPGQSAKLEVTFRPVALSPDIRTERVRCKVEGAPDQLLTLTGACVEAPAQSEVLTFNCAARMTATQTVTLTNSTPAAWQIRPTISGDMFSGPEIFDVPANGKATYTVTYRPLSMTAANQPHEGSLFFGVPDGSGLLYRLRGTASAPKATAVIERSIVAKQQHIEPVAVSNWLSRPQRFRVIVETKAGDVATRLEAPEYVDVPAHGSKDVKLAVYSYTASVTQALITFRNEETQEFSFYELKFSAAPPARQGTLQLECPIRVQASARVTVRNPLTTPVTLRGSATHKLVRVAATTVVEPGTTAQIAVTFRPILVSSDTAVLKLESAELGVYEWDLKLGGLPTNPDKALSFNVPLGGRESQVYRFTHWLEEKADFKVSFASGTQSMFEAPGTVSAQPLPAGGAANSAGAEAQLEVSFEPHALGDALRDTLILTSPTGGEYRVPLLGCCIAPRPQGPVDCSKGSGSVPFKNVFPSDAEYVYSVDNPAFTVKPGEKFGAKKSGTIGVTFKADPSKPAAPRTAKLRVTCPSKTSVTWVFYLQA